LIARFGLAIANYIVAALNLRAAFSSREARDWWAAIAWLGSGTFWAVTALGMI